jgi:ATP-dependent RNA helicase DDX5/DBP2
MRKDRQTLLFSATWPVEVQLLAERLLSPSHILVEVGGALASSGRANESIAQHVIVCSAETKLKRLVALLEELMDGSRLLVFASSKRRCDEITRELRIDGWCVAGRGGRLACLGGWEAECDESTPTGGSRC